MNLGLEGRVALVTAASKGLGRATALALAEEGARVAICARGAEALEATKATIGADCLAIPADVADASTPAALVAAAVDRWGQLDILVPNAGGPPPGRALEVDDESLRGALNANLLSSIRLVRAAAPHMQARKWGRICIISSYLIKQPNPTLALSNTARTALWAWAKTAAGDLAADGVTLNLACPGPHATDRMVELGTTGPMGDAADFGKVVAFLCSQPASFITGAALQVDGGRVGGLL